MEADTKKAQKNRFIERKQANAGKREYVVKTSLAGKIKEPFLRGEIDKWVLTVSKITNKGSLVLNRTLIHCLSKGIELPDLTSQTFYYNCMTIGINKRKFKDVNKALEETWNTVFNDLPKIERNIGDTQAVLYASKTYATNFKNSLVYNFDSRQKKFLRQKIIELGLDREAIHPIRCAINGFGCRKEVPEKAKEFVAEQRKFLGAPEKGITFTWLGTHMDTVVKYYWDILKYMEQYEDTKRFNIAPISRIKRHFLTIDTEVLYCLMSNVSLIDKKVKRNDFSALKDEHFGSVFNLNGLTNGVFSHMIETDGVSVCIHFKKPKFESKAGKRNMSRAERVIGIDPGRTNLIYGVEKLEDGSVKNYKLTRNQYYNSCGMKVSKKKADKWMGDIKDEELIFSRTNTKTTSPEQWDAHLKDYISVYDALWEGKTGKKWGQSRFRVYRLKRKTLDNFFQTMNGKVKPVIAFGAAKFNPNGKSELSAPTTELSRTCSKHFPVEMVDEFLTSQVCPCCDTKLSPVFKYDENGQYCQVRGLRRCCSSVCSGVSYKNRDQVGALNIMRCFQAGAHRPNSLSRNLCSSTKPSHFVLGRQGKVQMTVVAKPL